MSEPTEPTWDEGTLTSDDVIEAADGTGYDSVSDFVDGTDGHDQDPSGSYDADS